MRLILASLAAAASVAAAATPALANDARVEVRTGLGWTDGLPSKATAGGALGYDMGMGPVVVGVEQSIDKVLASGSKARWGSSVRAGAKVTPGTLVYATAGYNYGVGPNATDIGGGVEHQFSMSPLYGKIEYKHFFNEDGARDSNAALFGVGLRF
ncbi:MAG: hypothetical protein KGL48_01755 [Sphingomonadales bacterium]|nr:hypothetical protein [Sphingomonadales bacterium]MDE2569431.1 hypothetical protein [Sphingomonadales bacterium]